MGRYVSGDIDHKFWFAIQDTDALTRFGGTDMSMLSWYWGEEDLVECESSLKDIWKRSIEYTDKSPRYWINKARNGVSISEEKENIQAYTLAADFELGLKIRRAIKSNGECFAEGEY